MIKDARKTAPETSAKTIAGNIAGQSSGGIGHFQSMPLACLPSNDLNHFLAFLLTRLRPFPGKKGTNRRSTPFLDRLDVLLVAQRKAERAELRCQRQDLRLFGDDQQGDV